MLRLLFKKINIEVFVKSVNTSSRCLSHRRNLYISSLIGRGSFSKRNFLGKSSCPVLSRSFISGFPFSGFMTFTFGSLSVKAMSLAGTLVLDVAINWAGWALATIFCTEKFFDFFGTISFTAVTLASLINPGTYHARQIGVSSMILVWTWRLGIFLLTRVLLTGGDSRFKEMLKSPSKYFFVWTMQSVWVWVCSLPLLLLNANTINKGLGATDIIGIVLFVIGIICETTADIQKFVFKLKEENKGKFINTGIWKYSRYPNYFGEILIWWGIFLTSVRGLSGIDFVSVVSPLFVMLLVLGISGVPIQEQQAQNRWGTDPLYIEYKRKTNLLVPIPKFWANKQN